MARRSPRVRLSPSPLSRCLVLPDSSPRPARVRFGAFEVNLRTGETRKHGTRIKLQGQPLQILAILLEQPGEVVSREEMRRRLWPADTFVDFEHGLNTAVKKLRQALGDSAEAPRYVETLPRFGYRFIAPVENQASTTVATPRPFLAAAEPHIAHRAPTESRTATRRLYWALGLAAAILAAVLGYAILSPLPLPKVIRFAQTTITDHAEPLGSMVTDGARVYFLEREGDYWNAVQTSAAGGETRPLPVPFHNTRIFDVSPDHSEFLIGKFDVGLTGLPLWIWPVQGGSPNRIGDVRVDDASWCPNGQQIIYARGGDIRIVQRDGTGDRLLIHAEGRSYWLRWSPDGRRLSFTVANPQTRTSALWEISADGGNAHLRFRGWNDAPGECCGSWTPDGKYFLFASLRNGTYNLWALREKRSVLHWGRSQPVQLTSAATSVTGALSVGGGTRLLTFVTGSEFEPILYDVISRQYRLFLPIMPMLDLALSKDGKWAAVQRLPDWTLWRTRLDGTERVRLVAPPMHIGHPRWSPDGTTITFEGRMPGGQVRAYVVSAEGGPVQEVLPSPGEQGGPTWSPDGKSIALVLNPSAPAGFAGPKGIYIVDWQTRQATKIPGSDAYTSPLWSPDGKYFTAKTYDQRQIMRFDWKTGKWAQIASGKTFSGLGVWSHDSKFLYVQDAFEPGQPIFRLRAGDFRRERFLSFESLITGGIQRCALQDMAPDGSLVITLTRSGTHIYALDLDLP